MKANFPAEYMCAVLSAESGDTEKIAIMIAECKRMKIPVLPPDINMSVADFTVIKATTPDSATHGDVSSDSSIEIPGRIPHEDASTPSGRSKSEVVDRDNIRFGLYTIKNLGEAIGNAIIAERKANGPFTSYTTFLERVSHKDLNKKSLESLIRAGAFDSLGEERGVLLHNIDEALEYHKAHTREKLSDQVSLFSLIADTRALPTLRLKPAPEISTESKLAWEKELLGLYISGHPLDKHREKLERSGSSIKKLNEDAHEGMNTVVAGIIEEHKVVITKKNEHMAFLRIADFTGSIEVVVFPRTLTEVKEMLALDKMVAIKGRFSRRNDSPSLVAEKIKALE